MAQTATGEGPIVFFTKSGQQVVYHLTAVTFDGDEPKVTPAPASDDDEALTAWLKTLMKQGRLEKAPAEAPTEAMKVAAAEPGTAPRRTITVEVKPAENDATKVEVTIRLADEYADVTAATLLARLGSGTAPGSEKPGLVRVKPATATIDPVEGFAVAPGTQTTPPSWAAASATTGTSAFVVEARPTGATLDPALVKVRVSNVETTGAAGTRKFKLTASWILKREVNVGALATLATDAAFAVAITPPDGGVYKLPALGIVTLSGAADAAAAKPASATLLAGT